MHLLKQPSRPRHLHALAHWPRECDDRHIGVNNEFTSDVAATGKDIENIRRQTGILEQERKIRHRRTRPFGDPA